MARPCQERICEGKRIVKGCNVRNLPYMPLFIDRLLNSDTWIMASGDEAKAMITIWCAAWHQNEAGTLPNNDEVLKVLSRAGENRMQMRETVLSGFELNEKTNRLHHQVIQEIAAEAFGKTDRFRKAANARWNKKQSHNATHMQRINNASTNGDASHMQRIEENRIEDIPPYPPLGVMRMRKKASQRKRRLFHSQRILKANGRRVWVLGLCHHQRSSYADRGQQKSPRPICC